MRTIIKDLSAHLMTLQQENGAFKDPIYDFSDPRPTAEIAKSLVYLGKEKEVKKSIDWLLSVQNENGSWNEVLPDKDGESCVAAGTVGRLLLQIYWRTKDKRCLEAALKAGRYVLSKEFSPGYFIKSYGHYSDVLNVNATCAAFLYALYQETKEEEYIEARDRAIFNVVRFQFNDGAYPYASPIRTYVYEWHLNVRDPHYHAITLYFLLLADPELENEYLKISAEKAISWLKSVLTNDGFDWSKCKQDFSIGITGAYGYAAYCFNYFNKTDAFNKIIEHLKKIQVNGAYERYETPKILQTVKGVVGDIVELEYRSNTGYPFPVRIRKGIRRIKRDLIERRKGKRQFSLYYSAQILDCLMEIEKSNK